MVELFKTPYLEACLMMSAKQMLIRKEVFNKIELYTVEMSYI